MERKIGEQFEHKGKIYVTIEVKSFENCYNCDLLKICDDMDFIILGYCSATFRNDKKTVIFKEVTNGA